MAALALGAGPASAATFAVTDTADNYDGTCDAACSLRDAVAASAGTAEADVINLAAGLYTLSRSAPDGTPEVTGDLDITSDVTINGVAGATTVQQTIGDGVFEFTGANFTVNGLRVTGGSSGSDGGAFKISSGSLLLNSSVVSANAATNGGGISLGTGANARLTDVAIADNRVNNPSGLGGGIYATRAGVLELNRVTLSGNATAGSGGGIAATNGRSVDGTNVTLSGNSANVRGGGVYVGGGVSFLKFSTIAENRAPAGNGTFRTAGGDLQLANSIIANESVNNCATDATSGAAVNDRGGNLEGGVSCGLGTGSSATLRLGPLSGTGIVLTRPLRRGTQALNSAVGNAGVCPATDGRGVARPIAGVCDSGSHEQEYTDLDLAVTDSPDPIAFGGILTYTVDIANVSPVLNTGVQIRSGTLEGATFIDGTTSKGTTCRFTAPVIICPVSDVPPGERIQAVVRVRAEKAVSLTTAWVVQGDLPDLNPGGDNKQVTTAVIGTAPVTGTGTPVTPGAPLPGQPGSGVNPDGSNKAPAVTLRVSSASKRTLRRLKRLTFRATVDEASRVAFTLTLPQRGRKSKVLGRATVSFTAAGRKTVRLRITRSGLAALRRAKTGARLSLTARATDAAGARSTKRAAARIRR